MENNGAQWCRKIYEFQKWKGERAKWSSKCKCLRFIFTSDRMSGCPDLSFWDCTFSPLTFSPLSRSLSPHFPFKSAMKMPSKTSLFTVL